MQNSEANEKFRICLEQGLDSIIKLRGSIIETALQVEMELNAIIIQYYCKTGKEKEFLEKILFSKDMTTHAKLEIIKKSSFFKKEILYEGIVSDIQRVFAIRNDAAHKHMIITGQPTVFKPRSRAIEESEILDLNSLLDELNKIYVKIMPYLTKLIFEAGKHENDTPHIAPT